MTLQVIGAGFGRTGTASMKRALEILGYVKCHHMEEVMKSRAQMGYWGDVAEGKPVDWDSVFEGYEASVDFPSSAYYRELAEAYPDAKVVLTVRSPESWYTSARATIYEIGLVFPNWLRLFPHIRRFRQSIATLIWENIFDGKFEDEAHARMVFERHNDEVQKAIPEERLLVMEAREGWAPLCAFLGKEKPDEPFPYVNDTPQFLRQIRFIKALAWVPWIAGALVLAVAIALLR
jgi:hypothetical protein